MGWGYALGSVDAPLKALAPAFPGSVCRKYLSSEGWSLLSPSSVLGWLLMARFWTDPVQFSVVVERVHDCRGYERLYSPSHSEPLNVFLPLFLHAP